MQQIIDILEEISSLISSCGYLDEADWLKRQAIQLCSATSEDETKSLATQVKAKIAGMGSLSDIYLILPEDAKFSKQEANQRLNELICELDKQLNTVLHLY
jgi:hypothetical protein